MYKYEYPRPALTVDIVLFGIDHGDLQVLLIKRKNEPFKNCWATPGGFLEIDETVVEGARRELKEETGLTVEKLLEYHSFSEIDRDPRERIVTIAHTAVIKKEDYAPKGSDDAREANWFSLDNLPDLAADHKEIISLAYQKLKELGWYTPVFEEILSNNFSTDYLLEIYNCFYKRNFQPEQLIDKLLINENIEPKENGKYCFVKIS